MVGEYGYEAGIHQRSVTCLECGKELGGTDQPDPYKHMIKCLNVEPDAVTRIVDVAKAAANENGRRVIHLCNFILERQ